MNKPTSDDDLLRLLSERRNPRTADMDMLPARDLVARISAEDKLVACAVEKVLPHIAQAVDRIVEAFQAGGRLIYIGAGTSGRLGVLDASECPPTFSVPPGMVVGLIAGGDAALRRSIEGAEDDRGAGAADLGAVGLTKRDVVVGLSVGGRTPYAIGALEHAQQVGCTAIALTCVPGSSLARVADIEIAPVVGPEVLAGSTRMKSGSAHKMVLNMLSTASMVRIGKTYGNLMVDVAVSNRKLEARAVGIVQELTGMSRDGALSLLAASGHDVKCAILMELTGLGREDAKAALQNVGGVLRAAIDVSAKQRVQRKRA